MCTCIHLHVFLVNCMWVCVCVYMSSGASCRSGGRWIGIMYIHAMVWLKLYSCLESDIVKPGFVVVVLMYTLTVYKLLASPPHTLLLP